MKTEREFQRSRHTYIFIVLSILVEATIYQYEHLRAFVTGGPAVHAIRRSHLHDPYGTGRGGGKRRDGGLRVRRDHRRWLQRVAHLPVQVAG